jgi:hypothetical protein
MTTNTNTNQTAAKLKEKAAKRWAEFKDEHADSPFSQWAAYLLMVVLIALLMKIIAVNLYPFALVVGATVPAASNIPILGWFFDVVSILYTCMGAFLLWLVINLCELGWIFVGMDRSAERTAIREARAEKARQDADGYDDDRQTRAMRRRAVRIPFFYKAVAGWLALGAFVADAIINWKAFPLVKDWDAFWGALTLGIMPPIDWSNAGQQFFNLFNVEILAIAIIAAGQWIWMHKEGAKETVKK